MTTINFLVDKKDLSKTAFETVEVKPLSDGEVLLEIEKFAFTTNNITYAVFGERLNYWQFFPAEGEEGIVPAWGYAKVVDSKHAQVATGERVYGFLPMGRYLKVQVGKATPFGFADVSAHRAGLSPVYNFYNRVEKDANYRAAIEDFIPIIQPLFATSFLCYHFLKEQQFYGGGQVLLTSASAKTALSLAFMLKQNQKVDGRKIIGLTSARNVDFVKSTGFYDEVLDYRTYKDNLSVADAMLVDFAGNTDLLEEVLRTMGNTMKHITLIGFTDWQAGRELQNPSAEFFFAPTQGQKFFRQIGPEAATRQIANGLHDFIRVAKNWIELTYITEKEGLAELYLKMLKGGADPKMGYVVKPGVFF